MIPKVPFPKTFGKFSPPSALLELWKSCLVLFQAALGKAAQRIAFSIDAAASTTLPAPDHPLQSRNSLDLTRICLKNVCAILPNRVSTRLSQEPCLGVWT